MRPTTLRLDAVLPGMAGTFGLASDLLSYLSGSGPFGTTFLESPLVFGVVEAHALALLIGGMLWTLRRASTPPPASGWRSTPTR